MNVRYNEGEAAEHGIYYDDTEYDYMQHVRDIGSSTGDGDSFFVEATSFNQSKPGKNKTSLEEALRHSTLSDSHSALGASRTEQLLGPDASPSPDLFPSSYQNQQDVPDALAGFQPDMDPRLREVLEALDDDAYVDDEEDIFDRIAKDGEEVTSEEFERNMYEEKDEDDGWESDVTERPMNSHSIAPVTDEDMPDASSSEPSGPPTQAWMKEFRKFKHDQASPIKPRGLASDVDIQSSLLTGASNLTSGRRKKRKGALTSSAGYSMTSSSLARTEGQTILDARFDRMEQLHEEDDEMDMDADDSVSMFSKNSMASKASNISQISNTSNLSTTSSQAPDLTSSDVGSIMDEFLDVCPQRGKRKGNLSGKRGIAELDEIRRELGPARVRVQKAR